MSKDPKFTIERKADGLTAFSLADERQSINSVTQLSLSSIDEMVARKDDLEYQLSLCESIISEGNILPFPIVRAVILLRKAKRYEEELRLCNYNSEYCIRAEREWDSRSAMIWKSPKLEKCVARIPQSKELLGS